MLPTAGYFRGVACPDHEQGQCLRPYCHFYHGLKRERSEGDGSNGSVQSSADHTHTPINNPTCNKGDETTAQKQEESGEEDEETAQPGPKDQAELLKQLVNDAVQKVLSENPLFSSGGIDPSVVMQSIDTTALMAQASSNLDKGKSKKKVYLRPPDTPSYNPTPIKELNKRKRSVEQSEDDAPAKASRLSHSPSASNLIADAVDSICSKVSAGGELTDFSSDDEDESSKRRDDFDILEEVLAEHSQNNRVKVKKKRGKELGKLHLTMNTPEKGPLIISDVQNVTPPNKKLCDNPKDNRERAEASYFSPPSPVFTSSSDSNSKFSSPAYNSSTTNAYTVVDGEKSQAPEGKPKNNTDASGKVIESQIPQKIHNTDKTNLQKVKKPETVRSKGHSLLPQMVHTSGARPRPSVRTWAPRSGQPEERNGGDPLEELLQQMDGEESSQSLADQKVEPAKPTKKYKVDLDKEIQSLTGLTTSDKKDPDVSDSESQGKHSTSKTKKEKVTENKSEEKLENDINKRRKSNASVKESEESEDEEEEREDKERSRRKTKDLTDDEDDESSDSRTERRRKRKRNYSTNSDSDSSHHRKRRKKSRKRHKRSSRSKRKKRHHSRRYDTEDDDDDDEEHDSGRDSKKDEEDEDDEDERDSEEDDDESGKGKRHKKHRKKSRHRSKTKRKRRKSKSKRRRSRNYSSSRSSSRSRSEERSRSSSRSRSRSSSKDRSLSPSSNKKKDKEHKEKNTSESKKDDKKEKSHTAKNQDISTPMPIDPLKIKQEKDCIVPDLSIVKVEKDDTEKQMDKVHGAVKGKRELLGKDKDDTKTKDSNKAHPEREGRSKDRKSSTDSVSDKSSSFRRPSTESRKSDSSTSSKQHDKRRKSIEMEKNSDSAKPSTEGMSMFDLVLASTQKPQKPKALKEISIFDAVAAANNAESSDSGCSNDQMLDDVQYDNTASHSKNKSSKSSKHDEHEYTVVGESTSEKEKLKESRSDSKIKSSSSRDSSHKGSSSHHSGSSSSKHRSSSSSSKHGSSRSSSKKDISSSKSSSKTKDKTSVSSSSSSKHSSKHSHTSKNDKNSSSSSSRRHSSSGHSKDKDHKTSKSSRSGDKDKKLMDNEATNGIFNVESGFGLEEDDEGGDSPLPDLSALDDIPEDDWEQMINSSDTSHLQHLANLGGEEDDDDELDGDDPSVMEECMRMFNEYQPEDARPQTVPKAKKVEGEAESLPGKQRVSSSSTGNLVAKKPGAAPRRKTPAQIMMERFQTLKEQHAKLKKEWKQQKQKLDEQSKNSSVTSSSSRPLAHPASSSTSAKTPHAIPLGGSKRRISHVPNVSSLLSARDKIKSLQPASRGQAATNASGSQTIAQTARGGRRVAHVPHAETMARPTIAAEFGSKVPQNIRQRYLNSFIDECLKFTGEKTAFKIAKAEERVCYNRASSRMVYLNLAVNALKRVRTTQEAGEAAQELINADPNGDDGEDNPEPSTSSRASGSGASGSGASSRGSSGYQHPINPNHSRLSHFSVLAVGGQKGSWSIEKPKKNVDVKDCLKGATFYKLLKKYLLTQEQLTENGYPQPDPDEKGKAVITAKDSRKKTSPSAVERYCDRCSVLYRVDKWGFPTLDGPCVHHWGRAYKRRGYGGLETRYSCCGGDLQSEGCSQATTHVSQNYDPSDLRGYVRTLPKDVSGDDYGVYALDCEMCYTTAGNELTRITVIDCDGKTVYEQLVKPENPIIDYNTRFSGITEEDMEGVRTTILDVQAALLTRFNDKTILIGHSLESDFQALKLIHDTVVDTSVVFPHKMGPPYKRALRNLASEYLKRIIQNDVSGHDSAEDAITCMHLMHWRVKEDFKRIKK